MNFCNFSMKIAQQFTQYFFVEIDFLFCDHAVNFLISPHRVMMISQTLHTAIKVGRLKVIMRIFISNTNVCVCAFM